MTWAALAVVAVLLSDRSDNVVGEIAFLLFAIALFTLGLLTAPWSAL